MSEELTISRNLSLVADRWGDRSAIIADTGEEFSYRELDTEVDAAANGFRELGVGTSDRVALLLPNAPEFVIAHFGALRTGAASVPINFRVSPREVEFILDDAGVDILVYDETFAEIGTESAERTGTHPVEVGTGEFEALLDRDAGPIECPAARTDTAIIAYTSGTTGQPKGIPHPHDHTILGASQVIQEMAISRRDRALHIAPLFHTVDLHCFFNPHWFVGATNVLQRRFDPEGALALIEEHEITGVLGVPVQIQALLRARPAEYDLSSLQYVRTGGDSISERTIERSLEELAPDFYNTYGLTECQQNVTAYTPDDPPDRASSVGKASYFWDVRVVEPAKPGNADPNAVVERPGTGMVLVRGPMTTEGYLNRPDATENLFVGDWVYTGDVADVDADGYLTIVDRMDNMIVSGGENVYPQEVERVVGNHPAVVDCGVFGIEDEEWGQRVTAAIVLDEVSPVSESELDEFLKRSAQLANFKRPRGYIVVEEIPRNPGSGSIQRGALAELDDDRS